MAGHWIGREVPRNFPPSHRLNPGRTKPIHRWKASSTRQIPAPAVSPSLFLPLLSSNSPLPIRFRLTMATDLFWARVLGQRLTNPVQNGSTIPNVPATYCIRATLESRFEGPGRRLCKRADPGRFGRSTRGSRQAAAQEPLRLRFAPHRLCGGGARFPIYLVGVSVVPASEEDPKKHRRSDGRRRSESGERGEGRGGRRARGR